MSACTQKAFTGRWSGLLFIFFILLSLPLRAAPPPLEDLVRHARYQEASLSPDGSKLAVVVMEDGARVLAIMTLDPLAFTYIVRFTNQEEVGDFDWVSNERVLISLVQRYGWFDDPLSSGRMYAVDYDGKKGRDVFGYLSKEGAYAHAAVIDPLEDDRKHVLINTYPWSNVGGRYEPRFDSYGEVLKLNVFSGRTSTVAKHPARGARADVDNQGEVQFAVSVDDEARAQLHRLSGDEWSPVDIGATRLAVPMGYSDDGKSAYFVSDGGENTLGLVRYAMKEGTWDTAYRNDRVDVRAVSMYPGRYEPMVVHIEDGRPDYYFLDPEHPYSAFYRAILKTFDGQRVEKMSSTRDGKLTVFRVSSDRSPGDYYLANSETRSIGKLFSSADWLDPASAAPTEVINLTARDGTPLQGYLTFPAGGRKNLPMVVVPHGGPAARDYWRYDGEGQILASRGYLVLRVNFRGSAGYGAAFQAAADGHWGTTVQDDITDAVKWAVREGFADPGRICIYGTSFGGYSAMMSAIREPELYQCAAGYAGVYDLTLMESVGDVPRTQAGLSYVRRAVTSSEEQQAAQSPVRLADRIKVPIFIAHGTEDLRAPIEHAEAMIDAARANNIEYRPHINKGGGHGFYTEESRLALYRDLLAFLDEHLGK